MSNLYSEERANHPRPDYYRKNYQLLNGDWDFCFDDNDIGIKENWQYGETIFEKKINVPFCYQSEKSGIADVSYHPVLWYKKRFKVDSGISLGRVFLCFGAVDYACDVFINGHKTMSHKGGYTPFDTDITDYLLEDGNIIVVRVEDYRDTAQPRGKQYWEDGLMGCWYTPCSGIWRDVYIESRGEISIDYVHITPDIDEHSAKIDIAINKDPDEDISIEYSICFGERLVRKVTSSMPFKRYGIKVDMLDANRVDSVRLWSPETPDLYEVNLRLLKSGQAIDEVSTYFGMRKVAVKNGLVLLNNTPVYQRLVLDQGYWPDSLLTPPDTEAVKKDVEYIKAFGFNGVRKHQKIEDPRFYYWCDRLGLLCWGELPSAYEFNIDSVKNLSRDLTEFIKRDYNHPCIIAWVPLNESWGVREIYSDASQQKFSLMLYYLCKSMDKTRLVSVNDGWEQTVTDISAIHDYTGKGEDLLKHFSDRERVEKSFASWRMSYSYGFTSSEDSAFLITEYGGIAMKEKGTQGTIENMETWGYNDKADSEQAFIERFASLTNAIRNLPYCVGYCYTQLTDVMQEINGLLTPEREPKIDPAIISGINKNPEGR